MVLSVSLVVLFGAGVFFAYRYGRTTILAAVCATLFGFCLASTGVAPAIHQLLATGASVFHP